MRSLTKVRELTPTYDYFLNRFSSVFAGVDLEGVGDDFAKHEGIFGFRYRLPVNFRTRVWVNTAGDSQLALGKHLELTPRLMASSESETTRRTVRKSGRARVS